MSLKLSVIIPVYNRSEKIIKALNSIPKREDIEIIVVDDCSTDSTFELISNYVGITAIRINKNLGPGNARNKGLDIAKGEYITFLDSDDWFISNNLLKAIKELDTNHDIYWFKNKFSNGKPWWSSDHKRVFQGAIVKRSLIGSTRYNGKDWGEDSDFTLEVVSKRHTSKDINYQIYVYDYRPGDKNKEEDTLTYKFFKEHNFISWSEYKNNYDKLKSLNNINIQKDNIKISVIIPTYNRADKIIKALDSIPKREDIEIIVIDDCSTDNTIKTLVDYKNLNIIKMPVNGGPGLARNAGLDISTGEYIAFLDSDDWFKYENINKIINNYNSYLKYDILWFNNKTNWNKRWHGSASKTVFQGALVKKSLIGNLRQNNKLWGEDVDFTYAVKHRKHKEVTFEFDIYVYNCRPGSETKEEDTLTYRYFKEKYNWGGTKNKSNTNIKENSPPSDTIGKEVPVTKRENKVSLLQTIKHNRIKTDRVDLVINYVNKQDKNWQKQYNKYKKKEASKRTNLLKTNNTDFRDLETIKYLFRSIDLNCKWLDKIYLVVPDKSHTPDWLNVDNRKIKIIEHKDFIPESLLPTFNNNIIEVYASNINDLSNNFIFCDSNTIFNSRISETNFFVRDKIVYDKKIANDSRALERCFTANMSLISKITGETIIYDYNELPHPRKKHIEKEILQNYSKDIINNFKWSRFKDDNDFSQLLFVNYMKVMDKGLVNNCLYSNQYNINLNKSNINNYKNCLIFHIVDIEDINNFEECKAKLLQFLLTKFNEKSKFEKI